MLQNSLRHNFVATLSSLPYRTMARLMHTFPLLFLAALLYAPCHVTVNAQQPPTQSLGDVLHQVLDKDKDGKVTMTETESLLQLLGTMMQGNFVEEDAEVEKYRKLLSGVKAAAPTMFELLDSNSDGGLTKKELSYVTRFEKSLKKEGGMREFLREVFASLDADGDDQVTPKEIVDGAKSDEVVSKLAEKFHDVVPFRPAKELEGYMKSFIEYVGGNSLDESSVAEGIQWIDDDGDGIVQRNEVGKHYKEAGKQFLEISKMVKQLGPMMAMFGGMDMNNMNNMNGGARMDL